MRTARPTTAHGFNLFAGVAALAYGVNRVNCGIVNNGTNCVDPTGSPVNENGFWPRGTQDNYVFNSGLQIAAFIPPDTTAACRASAQACFKWASDTVGAFFFDPRGDQHHGDAITNIFNSGNSDDLTNWPSAANVVDTGLFSSVLIGRKNVSQQDLWVRYWDGNPSLATGRKHSMGLLVDQRIMGWNFPSGNEDIIYVSVRFINITSGNRSDYDSLSDFGYTTADIDDIFALAQNWRATSQAAYNVQIPIGGFPWNRAYASYAEDPDIGNASFNYSNADLIFNTVAAYKSDFSEPTWTLPTAIFSAPFAAAPGFMGIKYLSTPGNLGITLAGNTTNGPPFPDAQGVPRLWRNLSGNLLSTDGTCNAGGAARHQCFWNQSPSDTRMFAASGPFTVAPGHVAETAVALVWAAPVASLASATPGVAGNTTISAFSLSQFVNAGDMVPGFAIDGTRLRANTDTVRPLDRAMGFVNYSDVNNDGTITQDEVQTVPRSLLGKELVAQAVFDNKFLLPFAPEAPGFFLIPGDGQVTIAWQKSTSETTGNPFFTIAQQPTVDCPGVNPTHIQCPNSLYDPNFREFDVEGYRIWRGRTQAEMTVVASFDYQGTIMNDFTASFVDVTQYGNACAPELGIQTSCPTPYTAVPGNPNVFVTATPVPEQLVSPLLQVPPGGRVPVAVGNPPTCPCTVQNNVVDTAITGNASGLPPLTDNGVPFAFVDHAVLNGVRYFYAVSAFSINSVKSGPSSLESPLVSKTVIPRVGSPNEVAAALSFKIVGDGDTVPNPDATFGIDSVGRFTGTPPATGVTALAAAFAPLVPQLLPPLDLTVTIDSVKVLSAGACGTLANTEQACFEAFDTFQQGSSTQSFGTIFFWPIWEGFGEPLTNTVSLGSFPVTADSVAAARFGIPNGFAQFNASLAATVHTSIRTSQMENAYGRRLFASVSPGGSRWFTGANETLAHPGIGRRVGHLTGVDTIFAPLSHIDPDPSTAGVQVDAPAFADGGGNGVATNMQCHNYALAPLGHQADLLVTWGAGGTIASVRDLTYHTGLPFKAVPQASYGFIGDANGNGVIDWRDFDQLEGVAQNNAALGFCAGTDPGPGNRALLVANPVIMPVSVLGASPTGSVANMPSSGTGFGMYIDGDVFIFQLTGGTPPASGTQWTLRQYAGTVTASSGASGLTPSGYSYTAQTSSPLVPGLKVVYHVDQRDTLRAGTKADMSAIHTVPDPYYVTTSLEQTINTKILRFVNLPAQCIIRIYSASGVLVNIVTHNDPGQGGEAVWDLRNRNNQFVASGVYFYHVEASDGRTRVGRFTVVNFAQ